MWNPGPGRTNLRLLRSTSFPYNKRSNDLIKKIVGLPKGNEQVIDQATEVVKTRLKSRTPKGET